jgi:hypothetical protein
MLDLTRTLSLVKGALFDAEATWRSYLPEAGNWQKTAFLLTGPLIVASAIAAYLIGLLTSDASMFGQFRPTIISTLMSMVMGTVAVGIFAFIFNFFSGTFGGKNNFALGLAAVSFAFVPGYVGQALTWLPWVGGLLALVLAIYGLVLLWRIIPVYLEVPDSKRTLHYIVSLVTCIIVMVVVGNIAGRMMYGSDPAVTVGGMPTSGSTEGQTGSVFGGAMRQAELIAAAEEDRYSPPADGEISKAQVEEFVRVVERAAELQDEKNKRLEELAEKADSGEDVSIREMTELMGAATQFAGLHNSEIEVVKSAGGNWAEHQWVHESLRTAWLQKDINDTIKHNYEHYERYEEQLASYISR